MENELNELSHNDPNDMGFSAGPVGDNIYDWAATIIGPPNTPYANGLFFLDLKIPPEYPNLPPRVKTHKTSLYSFG